MKLTIKGLISGVIAKFAGVDSNALTLADYAMLSNDPLVMKITHSLLMNGVVFADIPFINKKTLVANGVRWQDNLPTVNWAKLNSDLTVTKGKPTPYQEQAYLMRNAIDTDVKLLEDENRIVDPRVAQLEAYLMAVTYDFNDKFINNIHISGEDDAFTGLRYRLDNPTTYGLVSEMKIDCGAVDMSQSGMTSATANNFLEYIQQTLDYMGRPEGDGVVFYMNDLVKRRFARAIRLLGAGAGWRTDQDAFGRTVTYFNNARIVDLGRKADQSTRIITNTETAAGVDGASTHSSIYAACYGEDRLIGWQFESLSDAVKDVGLIGNGGVTARILIDWAMGLLPMHTRCMARMYGIKVS
jgi:hypothetical protein